MARLADPGVVQPGVRPPLVEGVLVCPKRPTDDDEGQAVADATGVERIGVEGAEIRPEAPLPTRFALLV